MATCPACQLRYPNGVSTCPADGSALVADSDANPQGPASQLPPGLQVGDYIVEHKLGDGGFGTVYAARHPIIGKRAAIKVLHAAHCTDPSMVSRFVAEARAVNQIRHRHIIDVFAFGVLPDGRQYFVMELLDGVTLDRHLHSLSRLQPEEALPILRAVARALDAAHAQGILHRDLKPENVFLTFDEEGTALPKLLDFGIAKLKGDAVEHKTQAGAPMGTPTHMSPEQCRGQEVGPATDVYALGVMAFELLTGTLPFQGGSVLDTLMLHVTTPPPLPSARCGDVPPQLDGPILAMLAKDALARPSTASEAVEALATACREAGFDVPLPRRRGLTNRAGFDDPSTFGDGVPSMGPRTKPPTPASSSDGASSTAVMSRAGPEPALPTAATLVGTSVGTPLGSPADAPPHAANPSPEAQATSQSAPSSGGRSLSAWMALPAVVAGAVAAFVVFRGAEGDRPGPATAALPPPTLHTSQAESRLTAGIDVPPPAPPSGAAAASGAPLASTAPFAGGAPLASTAPDGRFAITIVTDAPNAKVYEGGQLLGEAPAPIQLAPGPHMLEVRAAGRPPRTVRVEVTRSEAVRVDLPAAGRPVIDKDLTY